VQSIKPNLKGEEREQRGLKILLAEDNPVNQLVASRLLEREGNQVVVAANGNEVLAMHAEDPLRFDVILMDIQMPEKDGLETALMIRDRERLTAGHIPIVALTAHAMKGDRERCVASGMDGYVTKPIRMDELQLELKRCGVHFKVHNDVTTGPTRVC
jgi:CheY-like chemotaxis protein